MISLATLTSRRQISSCWGSSDLGSQMLYFGIQNLYLELNSESLTFKMITKSALAVEAIQSMVLNDCRKFSEQKERPM